MSVRCFPAPKGLLLPRAAPLLRELGFIGEAAQQDEPAQRAVFGLPAAEQFAARVGTGDPRKCDCRAAPRPR
jgi:hypothetical protein